MKYGEKLFMFFNRMQLNNFAITPYIDICVSQQGRQHKHVVLYIEPGGTLGEIHCWWWCSTCGLLLSIEGNGKAEHESEKSKVKMKDRCKQERAVRVYHDSKSELKKEQEEETDVWQGLGRVALDENGLGQILNTVTSSSVSKDAYSCIHLQNNGAHR